MSIILLNEKILNPIPGIRNKRSWERKTVSFIEIRVAVKIDVFQSLMLSNSTITLNVIDY